MNDNLAIVCIVAIFAATGLIGFIYSLKCEDNK
jgi:hypothetical protein